MNKRAKKKATTQAHSPAESVASKAHPHGKAVTPPTRTVASSLTPPHNYITPVRVDIPADAKPGKGKQFIKELGEAAFNFLPGTKMKFTKSPYWWDDFLLKARNQPEEADRQMMRMGTIVRGALQQLTDWASTANHLPQVHTWAQSSLADCITWLEEFGFVKLNRSPKSYGDAFNTRWHAMHPDGRGPSKYAVVKIFAHELLCKSDEILRETLATFPEPPPSSAPNSQRSMWKIVDDLVQWSFREGDKRLDEQSVQSMVEWFRREQVIEDWFWEKHLWPLMQEMWPAWIREPGREEFVGFGKVKMGLPLSEAKRKNGKLALEPTQWANAVRGRIKRDMMFERLFHGQGTADSHEKSPENMRGKKGDRGVRQETSDM